VHKKIYSIICIFFFLISCSDSETANVEYQGNREKIKIKIGSKHTEVSLNYEVLPQNERERSWKESKVLSQFSIGSLDDTTLYLPTDLKVDKDENIYVLDMAGKFVKKFDSKGKELKKFGRKGRGPGEFQSPFRIDVSEAGKLIVLDINQGKCEIFDKNKSHKIDVLNQPTGVSFVTEEDFVTLQILNPLDMSAIQKYNLEGASVDYENVLLPSSFDNITVAMLPFVDGSIINYKKEICYVPRFMNHFVLYDKNGKIKYVRETMDEIALPTYERKSFDVVNFRLPEEQLSILGASVSDGKLFLVSNKASKKNNNKINYVIDVYSILDGDYLYSFKYKRNKVVSRFFITENVIYLINHLAVVEVLNYELE